MPRRIALACLALLLAAGTAQAQVGFGAAGIPSRRSLARVNLDMQWHGIVPLTGAEKLIEVSIDSGLVFAQTNHANFYVFEAETGRFLWVAHLGRVSSKAEPASVNSFAVYVTNSNSLFALDRRTGRQMWVERLSDTATSATNADDSVVTVGLDSGRLMAFEAKTGKEIYGIGSNKRISSRPLVANRVIAFASEDQKLYVARAERPQLLWRFAASGPIVAPLGSYGVRTLLVPSVDKNIYSVDLFTGQLRWSFATGSPVRQEPLVADKDIYVVNDEGYLTEIDAETGHSRWTISTLGGRLLAVSATRVYLESHDDDLFVVDRESGRIVFDPLATFQRAGINLREYALGPTNRLDDRLYFATTSGLMLCLREINQPAPRLLRDPQAKPLGYIPPEGHLVEPAATPAPATPPAGSNPDGPADPAADPK